MVGRFSWRDAIIIVLAAILAWVSITGNRTADQRTCRRFNLLYRSFSDSLERARKNIPTLSYYKAHPVEKQKALDEIDRELNQYRQQKC